MIKCPNCSANLEYDVKDEKVTCKYCGSKFNPKELKVKVDVSEEHDDKNTFSGKSYNCQDCGATLLTFDETAITFCSYCGSQAMIESKMIHTNNPDYIIPFKKTKEECIKNYKKKIRKSFFAPSYMKSDIVVSKFRGIYIPYEVYELKNDGVFLNSGSKRSHRSGDYVYYDDYTIDTDTDTTYDGLSFDLLSKFYDKYSFSIPFDYKECEPFNPNYLAGFYADTKDVNKDAYDKVARYVAEGDAHKFLKRRKEYKKYGCTNPKMPLAVSNRKMGMFPIYFLAIRDKKQEHVNYAVINGQSGKVAASLPLDFKKYILVSLILSILIYLLIDYSNYLFLPRHIVIFSMIVSLISFFVSNRQMKRIEINRKHLDDLGFVVANKKKYKIEENLVRKDNTQEILKSIIFIFILGFILIVTASFFPLNQITRRSEVLVLIFEFVVGVTIFGLILNIIKNLCTNIQGIKVPSKEFMPFKYRFMKGLYKQLFAILLGAIVLYFNPVYDLYYYGVSFVAFLIIIISFYDLVKEHNEIVSNILPQLEKRGGDENE